MGEKSPDAFRTISEVADDLDLPQHVLRFWETRFAQIKPLKRGGGRRYYRPDDVRLLRGIRQLLYGDGYTIKGVQRILRQEGIRHVIRLGDGDENGATVEIAAADASALTTGVPQNAPPSPRPDAPTPDRSDLVDPARPAGEDAGPEVGAPLFAATTPVAEAEAGPPRVLQRKRAEAYSAGAEVSAQETGEEAGGDSGSATAGAEASAVPNGQGATPAGHAALSEADVQRLKAAVFELMECRRILNDSSNT